MAPSWCFTCRHIGHHPPPPPPVSLLHCRMMPPHHPSLLCAARRVQISSGPQQSRQSRGPRRVQEVWLCVQKSWVRFAVTYAGFSAFFLPTARLKHVHGRRKDDSRQVTVYKKAGRGSSGAEPVNNLNFSVESAMALDQYFQARPSAPSRQHMSALGERSQLISDASCCGIPCRLGANLDPCWAPSPLDVPSHRV